MIRLIYASVAAILVLAGALSGCARSSASIPLTGLSLPVPKLNLPFLKIPLISVDHDNDFSRMTWTAAFERLHERLQQEYPYSEWKAIDWEALEAEFAPRIEAAQAADDEGAYYETLRAYAASLRDANVYVSEDLARVSEVIGGGFGLGIITLDDGRVVANIVLDNGPAAKAGIQWGAQILEWNGQPVNEALEQAPLHWSSPLPATEESRQRQRERLLVRAPAGSEAQITFQNPGAQPQTITLEAEEDAFVGLQRTYLYQHVISEFDAPIESRTLESGIGYIRIYALSSTITAPFPGRAVRKAVDDFIAAEVPGLIIDVRGNTGGIEDLVPEFLQPFFVEEAVYKDVAFYNEKRDAYVTSPELRLMIRGGAPYFDGPIVVLVDESTTGAGEGLPMVLDRLPNVQIVGLGATHGSFGIVGGEVIMPESYVFYFPIGQSLDETGQIMLEANAAGMGGVQPDVRVPLTEENVRRLYQDEEDVVLEVAEQVLLDQLSPGEAS